MKLSNGRKLEKNYCDRMYDIDIHRKVMKSLRDAPREILNKFDLTVKVLKTNPIPWKDCDVKKVEGEENTYRIRIGNYRIIYSLEDEGKRIYILKFGKRKKIYRR